MSHPPLTVGDMRILHTSDWHLGRTLHGVDLHDYQRIFHEFLLRTVTEQRIDALVISGDVYDRAIPPVESVRLLDQVLSSLADLTTVILTPGNHDSAVRLGFGSSLMRPGIHVLASTAGIEHPVSVTDSHGEVLFFGLPFLDPDMARYDLAGEGREPLERSHEAVMRAAMDRVREKLALRESARSVVLAHTFLSGGTGSDSERDLSVGGVDSIPGSVFTGVDYVALGHLHGCQNMARFIPGDRPAAWYSGSPLAFSFSEAAHRKSVLVVEMDARGVVEVTPLPTPVPRRLIHLRGSLEQVLAQAKEHSEDWVHATILEQARPPRLQETLRASFPHLLVTEFESSQALMNGAAPLIARSAAPEEVVNEFVIRLTGAALNPDQAAIVSDVIARAKAGIAQ